MAYSPNSTATPSKAFRTIRMSSTQPRQAIVANTEQCRIAVNAPFAWQSNYTGAGISVALIDSGVSSHPDLDLGLLPLSRVVYNQSFVPGNSSASDNMATALTSQASSQEMSQLRRPFLQQDFQRNRTKRKHRQPARARRERSGYR